MLVDSHAHLDDPRFADDREAVLERAWEAGVRTILTIGNGAGPHDMGCGIPLAEACPWVFTSIGIHPHDARHARPGHFRAMEELARHSKVVAIGEAGLDYHYDHSPRGAQREVFRAQLEMAGRLELPVIVHTREAEADTIEILNEAQPGAGVLHCFTGSPELADCALELGLAISFSGILTFKDAGPLRSIAARVPSDRLLVETDAPYLAPVPHRGRRNEPSFVRFTAAALAALRGTTLEVLAEETSLNFQELFARS